MTIFNRGNGTSLLCKVTTSNDCVEHGNVYIEFTVKELDLLLSYETLLPELKQKQISTFNTNSIGCLWLANIIDEDLESELDDKEYMILEESPKVHDEEELRQNYDTAVISEYGVQFITYEKYSNSELSTYSVPFSVIKELRENCDPNSKKFILEQA